MSSSHVGPLVHRYMKADEWRESYLLDVVRAHGVMQPKRHDADNVRRYLPLRRVSGSASPADERIDEAALRGYPQYAGTVVPTWAAFSAFTPIQYCPHCLIEDRYLRARWRLSSLHICLVHGCFMKRDMQIPRFTQIRKPGNYLSYWDASNADLLQDTEYCSAAELKVFASVWGTADQALREGAASGLSREDVAEEVAWAIFTWSTLETATRNYCFGIGDRRIPYVGPIQSIATFVDQFSLPVSPSFNGIKGLFRSLGRRASFSDTRQRLVWMLDNEQKSPSLVSRLRIDLLLREIELVLPQDAMWSFYDDRGLGGGLEGVKLRDLAQLLEVSQSEAVAFVRNSSLADVCLTRLGPYFRVPQKRMKDVFRWRAKRADLDEFQKMSGLDLEAALRLTQSRNLQTEEYAWWRLITINSLSCLLTKLELHCSPLGDSAGRRVCGLFSQEAREIAARAFDDAGLIQAVLQGKLPAFRSLDKPGLSSFFVTEEDLRGLCRERDNTSNVQSPLRVRAVYRQRSNANA